MIVACNSNPNLSEFKALMKKTDAYLNNDAKTRSAYYKTRAGKLLEDDVEAALNKCAINTPFAGTIVKVSGQKFPDIVASNFYGIEVKSTKENHWTSTGSSIMENTRVEGVERIYMMFGKLGGNPVEFLSRPYEDCLYGIAVTHMPRYLINMRIEEGETIFDKIGIPYDELRKMDNPIAPVARYYRSQLKEGESLWWAEDTVDDSVPVTIKLWKNIPIMERKRYIVEGCIKFPEIFKGNYDRYSLWLASRGIVDSHIRDQFSSGGQESMLMPDGTYKKFPAIFRRVKRNVDYIKELLKPTSINNYDLFDNAHSHLFVKESNTTNDFYSNERIGFSKNNLNSVLNWCSAISLNTPIDYSTSMDALCMLFFNSSFDDIIKEFVLLQGEEIVVCQKCGKLYRHKRINNKYYSEENDACPYCGYNNGSDMVDNCYINRKL